MRLVAVAVFMGLSFTSSLAGECPTTKPVRKEGIGALRLLKKIPADPGSAVVVALFKPSAEAASAEEQHSSTADKVELVELASGSNSGNIAVACVRNPNEKHEVAGVTGRLLSVPLEWKNPSRAYYVGVVRAYDLLSGHPLARLKDVQKKKWDAEQSKLFNRAKQELSAWDNNHPNPNREQRTGRGELALRLEILHQLQQSDVDPGPIYDCLVFHDGNTWRAAIDMDQDGDLADEKVLANLLGKRPTALVGSDDFSISANQKGNEQAWKAALGPLEDQAESVVAARRQLVLIDDADRKPHLPEIVELCDKILATINTDRLCRFFCRGVRGNPVDGSDRKLHTKMVAEKELLVDTLYRKARAIAYMDLPAKYSPPDSQPARKFPETFAERDRLFEQTYAELSRWVDPKDAKYILLYVRRERRQGRPATALKALNEHIENSPPKKLLHKKRADLYDELGWDHWRDCERNWMLVRFPFVK